MDDTSPLVDEIEPRREVEELQQLCTHLWRGDFEDDVVREITEKLRFIEGAVCRKYETLPKEVKGRMDIGELSETLETVQELNGNLRWVWRYPSLFLTVAIASCCIPFATYMEHVIQEHPILGGFPPAISAAAGCIGIQNTAIIVRALGVKLIKTNPFFIFVRYTLISLALSVGAAVVEMIVAWIVVSLAEDYKSPHKPWSFGLILEDVPIVIFFAMIATGFMAGVIGAGVPLLVSWISEKIKRHLDPAHWVGPIETVVQELSAALLTFWIADTFVFN